MKKTFEEFVRNESGAVTVDWVVLTGAVVGLAISAVAVVTNAAVSPSEGIGAKVETLDVATY